MKVPITRPYFDEEDKRAVAAPLDSGWVTQGPRTAEFEQAFAQYIGVNHAAACSSCTTGLHLILAAMGVGPGDEVVVPSFTFVASANAVEYVGAKPVFCDIDLATFNIDSQSAQAAITPRTKAVMAVHLFGLCADMPALLRVAQAGRIPVIEDAACAVGSKIGAAFAGALGEAAAFSFHPRKVLVTGEGGMVTTNSQALDARVKVLRNHAATVSDLQRHNKDGFLLPEYASVGFNYRMTDMQSALGLSQLAKLDRMIERRQQLARRYDELLKPLSWLAVPSTPAGYRHTYQSYVALVRKEVVPDDAFRNRMMKQLEEAGVATRQGTHAVHLQAFYRGKYRLREQDFPNSTTADRRSLSLPMYYTMTDAEQDYVVEQLRRCGPGGPAAR